MLEGSSLPSSGGTPGWISHPLHEFEPDIIHITGPSELGIFGAFFAWKMGIPLAARESALGYSWDSVFEEVYAHYPVRASTLTSETLQPS